MKSDSRPADPTRQIACQVLHRVLEEGAYANLVLASMLAKANLTAQQRAFATALVYGTLTRLYTIDHILGQTLNKSLDLLQPAVRTILRLGAFQLLYSHAVPASAACDESVRLCRVVANQAACGLVNATLRTIAREKPVISEQNQPLFYSLPPELYGYLKKACGAVEAPLLAARLLAAPPVTLRVNMLKSTIDEVIDQLADEGIAARRGRYAPEAVVPDLSGHPVQATSIYRDGLASVQDEGAMLTTRVLDPQPGDRVIDLCAAPGGKSTHIAEYGQDQIDLIACDIHENRLSLITNQALRLGIHHIQVLQADATGADWPETANGPFDRVLADVPCSGLGLLARKPEIRKNMTHERILGLLPLQAAILDHAGTLVKPGGVLVYSTCTFNPAENDGQVDSFLQRSGGCFQRDDMRPYLPETLLTHPDINEQAARGSITLLPHRQGTDGFYIARLRLTRLTGDTT
jgi:16S rRNA (cytosine967-C5)-methyltransferase